MKKILFTFITVLTLISLNAFPVFADTTAVNVSSGSNLSSNWAGYAAQSGQYTSVSGSWTVPTVGLADLTSGDATWVGIGGLTSSDLIQSGTQAVIDSYGNITYNSWYELLPSSSVDLPVTVKAGDYVSVAIEQISSGVWQISFRNNTTGQSYVTNVNYSSSLSSAEWIEEMPMLNNSFLPLDNFGTTNFTNGYTTKNGSQMSISAAGSSMVTMVNSSNQVTASTSGIGSDGASFSVARTTAAAGISSSLPAVSTFRGRGGVRTGMRVQNFVPHTLFKQTRKVNIREIGRRITNKFSFQRMR